MVKLSLRSTLNYLMPANVCLGLYFLGTELSLWNGPSWLTWPAKVLELVAVGIVFAAICCVPVALFLIGRGLLRWKRREQVVADIARGGIVLALAIGVVALLPWSESRRLNAFARASANAVPVIQALAKHHQIHGEYPHSLEELTPKLLARIPSTGLVGYPEFRYLQGYNDIHKNADSYELRVDCGCLDFDRFCYWPSESYPATLQRNRVIPIGAWIYVDE